MMCFFGFAHFPSPVLQVATTLCDCGGSWLFQAEMAAYEHSALLSSLLDCNYWVGSLDFNFSGNHAIFH